MKKTTDVVESIKQKIITGELSPGDRLPSIKKLAELCKVSTITVRNAIEQLVLEGFIETRERSGCYVKAPANRLIRLKINNEYSIQDEILDVRILSRSHVVGVSSPTNETENSTEAQRAARTDSGNLENKQDQQDPCSPVHPSANAIRTEWLYTTFFEAPVAYEECFIFTDAHEKSNRLLTIDDRKALEECFGKVKRTTMKIRLIKADTPIRRQMRLVKDSHAVYFEKTSFDIDDVVLAICKAYVLPESVLFLGFN